MRRTLGLFVLGSASLGAWPESLLAASAADSTGAEKTQTAGDSAAFKPPGFLALEPNGRTIELKMVDASGRHLRFRVLDGLINRLTAVRPDGKADRFDFIAKVHLASGALALHPVRERTVMRDGVARAGWFMDAPVAAGSALAGEFGRVGLTQLSMGLVSAPIDPRFSTTKSGGWSPDQGLQWRCCDFQPCPPYSSGTFCTYGSGCGGDGCGECCV
jgi:hypothetical protein